MMPEEQLFETEESHTRSEIAEALVSAAEQIEAGTVQLEDGSSTQRVDLPESPTLEVELERLTDSETGDDDSNLLVAQLVNSKYDVETVIARVNRPRNVEGFEELGVRAISANESIAQAMDNAVERPALSEWMTELGRDGDVQEIEVTADRLVGTRIEELDTELPDGVIIALVSRDGDSQIPDPDLQLEHGDHLTFVGRHDAVHDAIGQCHPGLHS